MANKEHDLEYAFRRGARMMRERVLRIVPECGGGSDNESRLSRRIGQITFRELHDLEGGETTWSVDS